MERETCDIFISGGGVAGLTAAAVFGSAGFSVVLADPAPPVTDEAADGADLRTTAFLQPAVALLAEAGVWDRLLPEATELEVMRIVDAGGPTPEARLTRDFRADEIGAAGFGWNLPNWQIRRALLARLAELPSVSLRQTGFRDLLARDETALLTLDDGTRLAARLVIGADGRASPVRSAAGIGVRRTTYGQSALVFTVTHPVPHHGVSTEIHRTGGPFTLVPMPDHKGEPRSSVVWMMDAAEARRRAALDPAAFATEATARSAGVAGPLTLVGRRQAWPIVTQVAERMTARRTALIAEAAHVVPPIGAQGLNMSLGDVAALKRLAVAASGRLGDAAMLDAYARARTPETRLRAAGVDLLNRASQAEAQPLRDLRAAGLTALHALPPVRRTLMRLGLGGPRQAGG